MSTRYIVVGQVYISVNGTPNVRMLPERLDCLNYVAFWKLLKSLDRQYVRITIDTLDSAPEVGPAEPRLIVGRGVDDDRPV
jgi:hypothetical protein